MLKQKFELHCVAFVTQLLIVMMLGYFYGVTVLYFPYQIRSTSRSREVLMIDDDLHERDTRERCSHQRLFDDDDDNKNCNR